jgi:hypothetical protein
MSKDQEPMREVNPVPSSSADFALPPELKAVEAELAGLRPRTDRLQRDRLLYLAGQASFAGASSRRSALLRVHWAWPATAAVMSAVAATLLVMLLSRPGPQIVERFVERPAARPDAQETRQANDTAGNRGEQQPVGWPDGQKDGVEPATEPASSVWVFNGWLSYPDGSKVFSEASYPYLHLRDQVLARGIDAWPRPRSLPSQELRPTSEPRSYRQLLDRWLEENSADAARG